MHVAYLLKQYPRLSETFILNEILGLEEQHVEISVYSLRHATEGRFHPGIAAVRGRVHYVSDIDRAGFLEAVRAVPDLRIDRLPAVFAFLELLPSERRSRLLFQAMEVARCALDAEVDHIHAHFLTIAAHTAHIVHLLTDIPYSVTAHAKDVYRHSIDWGVARQVAGSASAVVTVCDANLSYLACQLEDSGARLHRIYNGLGPQDPAAQASSRQPGMVLGVGRLVEKKGFDILLSAIARLVGRGREVGCVIVGDGDQGDLLRRQAIFLGIENRVTFTGALPQDEVARIMRRAQVLAAPCRIGADGNQDALPTVLLEALGAGTPSITTPVAGCTEIVSDGIEGLIVDCDDIESLADAIEWTLQHDEWRASVTITGPAKLAAVFDRAHTIGELLSVFESKRMVTSCPMRVSPRATPRRC